MEKRSGWWQVLLRNCFSGFSLTERHHNKGIVVYKALGNLNNYDDNENVKKQLVLWAKQLFCTCITLFSTFLWRPLHEYDVKPPNATSYGGRGHMTANFPFFIWTWIEPLRIQLQEKLPIFWRIERFQIDAIKFERTQINFFWWCFHCSRRRCCLSSLFIHNQQRLHCKNNTLAAVVNLRIQPPRIAPCLWYVSRERRLGCVSREASSFNFLQQIQI